MAFCWLPPLMERQDGFAALTAADVIGADQALRVAVKLTEIQDALFGKRFPIVFTQRQVLGQCEVHKDADALPVLWDVRDAGFCALADGGLRNVGSTELDGTAVGLQHTGNGVGQLALPISGDAGNGKNLAAPNPEGNVFYHTNLLALRTSQMVYLQDGVPIVRRGLISRKLHLAAHHHIGHGLRGGGRHIQHIHQLAAVEDGAAVGNFLISSFCG